MADEIDERRLRADFDSASVALKNFGSSSALSLRRNVEQKYALAYQRLVRAGLAMQIRAKYRKVR